jgi:hypothetical protein
VLSLTISLHIVDLLVLRFESSCIYIQAYDLSRECLLKFNSDKALTKTRNNSIQWLPTSWRLKDQVSVVHVKGVRQRLWTAATNGTIVHPSHDKQLWRRRWNDIDRGKTEEFGEKHVPVPLYPPQIPHGPTGVQTRVSAISQVTPGLYVGMFRANTNSCQSFYSGRSWPLSQLLCSGEIWNK